MDRPILFSGPMVRALIDGHKTQTRRVVTPQPDWDHEVVETRLDGLTWPIGKYGQQCGGPIPLPRFAVGDRLWVRESIGRRPASFLGVEATNGVETAFYKADDDDVIETAGFNVCPWWKAKSLPGMHMPRWASRLTLIVTDVRVQRLQEINEVDAWDEGVQDCGEIDGGRQISGYGKTLYANLWDSLNADRGYGWKTNPWVCAVSFNVIKQNIDQVKP